MPLNESSGFRPSGLTREQKRQQEAAIYGLPPSANNSKGTMEPTSQLSHEDIERMRAILAQHDETRPNTPKTVDLNAPAKLPYRHQEFPRAVYHETLPARAAKSQEHLDELLASGYAKEPVSTEVEVPQLDAAAAAEAAAIDAKLIKRKR